MFGLILTTGIGSFVRRYLLGYSAPRIHLEVRL